MAAFSQRLKAYVDANLSPAARSKRLATLARQARDELIRDRRASTTYETIVDGRKGASEDQVRGTGGGTIVYAFSYGAEAAVYALTFLRARSPVRSGKFRESFWVSVDGRYIPPGRFSAASVPPGAEIIIGNTEPYNRKVDVQLAGNRRLRFSVPAGLYDDAARAINRQFRGVITCKRVYTVKFPGQYVVKVRPPPDPKPKTWRRNGNTKGRVQSPALVINPAQ